MPLSEGSNVVKVHLPCFIVTIGVVVLSHVYIALFEASYMVAFQAAELMVGGLTNPARSKLMSLDVLA